MTKDPGRSFFQLAILLLLFPAVYRLLMCIFPAMGYFSPWQYDSGHRFGDNVRHYPRPVSEVEASHFSHEALKKASFDFTSPVVVRGLYKDSVAAKTWYNSTRLPDIMAGSTIRLMKANQPDDHTIPVHAREPPCVARAESGTAFHNMLNGSWANLGLYLFGPVLRPGGILNQNEASRRLLQAAETDMGIQKESHGFTNGIPSVQLMAGNAESGGTFIHTEPGRNHFVCLHGRKRFLLMDSNVNPHTSSIKIQTDPTAFPLYSTPDPEFGKCLTQDFCGVPGLMHVTLGPGDYLFLPSWIWHAVNNEPGLSIGLSMRQVLWADNFKNNFLYSARWWSDHLWLKLLGYDNLDRILVNKICSVEDNVMKSGHSEL